MLKHLLKLHAETGGQAMTEFIIVFPVLFLLFLVIIQTALLMTARQVVQYAAFSAARSAIVYNGNKEKNERAANIACIPISPKMNTETLRALRDFALGLGETVIDTAMLLDDYPELIGLVFTWDMIPGMEIIDKLRHIDLSELIPDRSLKLAGGLLIIDALCRSKHSVLLRYPTAALLNKLEVPLPPKNEKGPEDVTVQLTHSYVMRVPLVNKLFFYMYIYGTLRNEIRARLARLHISQGAINEITTAALHGIIALIEATPTGAIYFLPITADSTLTIENDADTTKNCS
jgi:hypothetical protein